MSANHLGSKERAFNLISAVGASGGSHIKFQTYTADTMTINHDAPSFRISPEHELWGGRNLYDLYLEAHTPWEWHEELFTFSREIGLIPFSTPFDQTAVDFLETLDPHLYKIASMEIGDIPLIRYVAQTGKPLIMSTGTASLAEIDDAVVAARDGGCRDLTLLLCTSAYPAEAKDVHLSRMQVLRDRYHLPVGVSDHTSGIGVSIAAAALGASVIERHVTLRRADGGPDAAFSLEPRELATLVSEVSIAAEAIGEPSWLALEAEDESRRLRRSLFVTSNCTQGEMLTNANVRSIRPSGGLEPKYLDEILGLTLRKDVPAGTPLTWDLIRESPPSSQESTSN